MLANLRWMGFFMGKIRCCDLGLVESLLSGNGAVSSVEMFFENYENSLLRFVSFFYILDIKYRLCSCDIYFE